MYMITMALLLNNPGPLSVAERLSRVRSSARAAAHATTYTTATPIFQFHAFH